jgi:hypothetical protein
MKLGRGAGTDFLGISFSALDLTGHSYGPASHEVQDVLINLDVQIGLLLDKLDRDLGAGNYVVGLSADHGVLADTGAPQSRRVRCGTHRHRGDRPRDRCRPGARARSGAYRTRVLNNDVYFNDGVYLKLTQNPAAMAAVLATIRKADGVSRVIRKEELSATDPLTRQSFLSHYEGRSGEIKFVGRAYWITSTSTTTHGTGHRYDTRVPGDPLRVRHQEGRIPRRGRANRLAPTLAFLTGVTLPDAMGRVLTEALIHH